MRNSSLVPRAAFVVALLAGPGACDPDAATPGPRRDGASASSQDADVAIETAQREGRAVYRDPAGKFDALIHPTGAVSFSEGRANATATEIRMAGPERWDPAGTSGARRQFLARTEEARTALAQRWSEDTARAAALALRQDLEALWSRTDIDAKRKRAIAFGWWDDAAEGPARDDMSEVDKARHAHGARARATVLGFLREQAKTDPGAVYPSEELARLNASRASKAEFAPAP